MNGLNWVWIGVMAIVPFALGLAVAYPIWHTKETVLGNLAGAAVIFGGALVLILRESVEVERTTRACLEAGFTCWPDPSAFTRYAIYATVGLVQVCSLFMLSLRVEQQIRNRDRSPEWR